MYKLNSKLSVHQERLSTGKRINSAQDDIAAFSVAKNVETTKQGHERALQNIKNAQSVLSIVEAGQRKQLELLQEIKSENIKYTEMGQWGLESLVLVKMGDLLQEIYSVSEQMKFNGQVIADSAGKTLNFKVGSSADSNDIFSVTNQVIESSDSILFDTLMNNSNVQSWIDKTLTRISNTRQAAERLSHKEDMARSQIATNEAVRSNYEDADFAKEQMGLMKVQILQQTATAALAQANSAPQSVLSLFR